MDITVKIRGVLTTRMPSQVYGLCEQKHIYRRGGYCIATCMFK